MSNGVRTKIINFTDLNAWKESHALYLAVYQQTSAFPKEEIFGLTSQLRRAALSVSSNTAEGFGRSSDADKVHFYVMARSSLFEVQNQLMDARDIGLIDDQFSALFEQSQTAQRIIIGLINSTKKRSK